MTPQILTYPIAKEQTMKGKITIENCNNCYSSDPNEINELVCEDRKVRKVARENGENSIECRKVCTYCTQENYKEMGIVNKLRKVVRI